MVVEPLVSLLEQTMVQQQAQLESVAVQVICRCELLMDIILIILLINIGLLKVTTWARLGADMRQVL